MQQILRELSRRWVFRVAGLYVVVAWLVVQVAETTFPLLSLPDWSVTLALALALVGFPLALVLAWAYDVTPGGLRLGREGQPATEPVADGGAGEAPAGGGAGAREGGRSIAVLPFANLSANEENEYFSDGVTEEILDGLTKVTTLQVAAMAVIRKHLDLVPDDPRAHYLGAHALICLDRQEEAREWIERAAALDPEDPGVACNVACGYARLGEVERALDALERNIPRGLSPPGHWVRHDPDFDILRGEPRCIELLERLG